MNEEKHWTLDRRVPLALIWAVLAQTGVGIWWASRQEATINHLSQRQAALEAQRATDRVGERLSTLESQMMDAKDVLRRIDERTQRLVERQVGRGER